MVPTYFTTDCPHCGTAHAGFTGIAQSCIDQREHRGDWCVFLTCNHCRKGIVTEVLDSSITQEGPMGWNLPVTLVLSGAVPSHREPFVVTAIYPRIPHPTAPSDVPPKIAATYIEAQENLRTGKLETSMILSRKCMELATKAVRGEAGQFEKLAKRIQSLRTEGVITKDMAEWAHAVRLDANEFVHTDEDATRTQAEDLLHFTEAFLLYAFTLPAMVSRRAVDAASV